MKRKEVFCSSLVRGFMVCVVLICISSMFSAAYGLDPCYPGSALDNAPPLTMPKKEKWLNPFNALLAVDTPYHMAHDIVSAPGAAQTMVGKFDYGAAAHKDLEYERVHAYIYGTGMTAWKYLGVYKTNRDGKIFVNITGKPVGQYMVKMVVAGDLTTTYGLLTVVAPGRKAVVFDIDATLTINDFEIAFDYLNVKNADEIYFSQNTVNLYRDMGYQVIYLTARPYWVCKDTREWLKIKGYWDSNTHFCMSNEEALFQTEQYKTNYLLYLKNTVGMQLFRAYGNATTDIAAYENAGIPKSQTFILGTHAGSDGTMPIYGDYEDHYNWLEDTLICGY